MAMHIIQGQTLEVTVIGCKKLKDTEWIMRQDPYVVLEYGSTRYRTKTCTDGHRNPTFQEKFVFPFVQGLSEMNVVVWNSNSVSGDDFIGSGKAQLAKAITKGYDDTAWPLWTLSGKHAGEVRLLLHYSNNVGTAPPAYGAPTGYPATAPLMPPALYPPAYGGNYPPPPSGYPQSSSYSPSPYGAPSYGYYPPPY